MRFAVAFLCTMFLCILSSLTAWAYPTPTFRTVALSGQVAPGTDGAIYNNFSHPQIDAAGGVMFSAYLTHGGATTIANDTGVWSEKKGSLSLRAREGSQAPGTSVGTNFGTFHVQEFPTTLSRTGLLMVRNSLQEREGSGVWVERTAGLELVAREGGSATGVQAGALWSVFENPVVNSHGQVAFQGLLQSGLGGVNGENNQGVWAEDAGGLVLKVRKGDIAPGLPTPTYFGSPMFNNLRFNDAGQIAFISMINGPSVTPASNVTIWSEGSGTLSLVARRGDQAPDTPAGALFDLNANSGNILRFNNSGKVAFRTNLIPSPAAGVTTQNDQGLWSDASGSLKLVAREDNIAPGTNGESRFDNFLFYEFSDAGNVVFSANTRPVGTGLSKYGIWSADMGGEVSLIALHGDPAPGTSAGTTFLISRPSPILNPLGHVAFLASLTGDGVNSRNDQGIWAQDAAGNLRLVLREGESFEVASGDLRTISTITTAYSPYYGIGHPQIFNANHQLALRLSFTDSSHGIFTVSLAVPEPGSATLVLACIVGLSTLRKRWG